MSFHGDEQTALPGQRIELTCRLRTSASLAHLVRRPWPMAASGCPLLRRNCLPIAQEMVPGCRWALPLRRTTMTPLLAVMVDRFTI